MFSFRRNSKGCKISRRKCGSHLHPLAHQTWKVLSLPSKKAAECLLPWVGWKSGFEFKFCIQSYLLFYAIGLLNEMHKESLVPKIVPHPSRAVLSSELWDNQVSSYSLILFVLHFLLPRGSAWSGQLDRDPSGTVFHSAKAVSWEWEYFREH